MNTKCSKCECMGGDLNSYFSPTPCKPWRPHLRQHALLYQIFSPLSLPHSDILLTTLGHFFAQTHCFLPDIIQQTTKTAIQRSLSVRQFVVESINYHSLISNLYIFSLRKLSCSSQFGYLCSSS